MNSFSSQSGFADNIDASSFQNLENLCWAWSARMGFQQVRFPVIETRSLFERGVGNGTDVVEKEMFSLQNSDNVLRPEGTAQAMRAWLAAGGIRYGAARWAYCGPMFRNERPQAGRFRQFQQFGCEIISQNEGPVDADTLIGLNDLFTELGIREKLILKINTLGTPNERKIYRDAFSLWLAPHVALLDETSQKRLLTNPLRIWDSKDARTQAVLESAPRLIDYLGDSSKETWQMLLSMLDTAGIEYQVDTRLMRGLDYYNGLVFEWTTFEDKAQNAVAAGGRYDGLAESLGGTAATAFGFAIGLERVLALLPKAETTERCGYYIAAMPGSADYALRVARLYRNKGNVVVQGDNGAKLAKQIQRADKILMRYVIILGDTERDTNTITVKDLESGLQQNITF